MSKTFQRVIARMLLLTLSYQLVFPTCVNALTTGPSQPEVQSFEPVGTTEMVNMFTGDFTYNIPLLDIEGYPINIAYHSGVGIEQEASWVGLGWNINPGEINRSMRGLPDDFNGEQIKKEVKINTEETWRVGMGGSVSFEVFGWDSKKYGINLSLGAGGYLQFNNYRGMSVGLNTSASISVPFVSTGINMGIGSQDGADIGANMGLHVDQVISDNVGGGIGLTGGARFNSRAGLIELNYGVNFSAKYKENVNGEKGSYQAGRSFGSSVPIGLQNYVPVVSNPGVMKSFEFQTRFGGEVFYAYPNAYLSILKTTMEYETDGTKNGYGYLYAENAPNDAIMDFSRHNEGYYNNTLENLPLSSMTYDVYSVSGQGTGGVFRPFRNDIGSVFDPEVKTPKHQNESVMMEVGVGNLFEVGTDIALFDNEANSGPWKRLNFRGNQHGSFYEKVFFKQAGELTYNNQQGNSIYNDEPVYVKDDLNRLSGKGMVNKGSLPPKYGDAHIYWSNDIIDRTSRSNLFTFLTAAEASIPEIAECAKIPHFEQFGTGGSTSSRFYDPSPPTLVNRYGDKDDQMKAHQMSEITQTLADGRRYIYGIPAINHMTREVTFSVDGSSADLATGLVNASEAQLNGSFSGISKEDYYSSTATPAYAHSYLLTSVLSPDYMDILGDGPTDDDIGGWVKMNYTLWDNDYRWRVPYESDKAQFNPGFWSDKDDDKGNVVMGSRQQWHVRSIESKNYIAEFYVSQRNDGRGITTPILSTAGNTEIALHTDNSGSYSYKLDSIKLFNKHTRYIDTSSAVPIKTVIFKYLEPNSSLCRGIPNASSISNGKLTLEKIYTRYGASDKNLSSPYSFSYNNYDNAKHQYNFANKDRWGNFKDNSDDPDLTNYEFPYTKQDGAPLDADAAPYELTEIKLPSGGIIKVDYESDDYSFVQDKRAMQMFKIIGVGNSTNKDTKNNLYEDLYNINDYIYFERIIDKEKSGFSLWDNYLEGAEYLYYSLNMDITGTGKNEYVKGYAKIDDVGICSDDSDFAYVKLKRDNSGGKKNQKMLHPATIYGLNKARYYLPHIVNSGFNTGGGAMNILNGLLQAADELVTISENPIVRYIENKKIGKSINIKKSWIRLCRPGLSKKGGGVRVKQLTLNDSWSALTSNEDAEYGKTYEYTSDDSKYGIISSGVASYEPLIGGDENPFKLPVKYTADAGRLRPAIEFFQEEPFGESFFPPPVVGYSKVTVKSIHIDEGRSSQSVEEYEFYTAKDFPIEVDYTRIERPKPEKSNGLRKKSEEVKAYQGYVLTFNDMHGKPRNISNYVIRADGAPFTRDLVSSVKYEYQRDAEGKLDNNVLALYRLRGHRNTYDIDSIRLGEEIDFTVDTRERYNRSYRQNIDMSLNVVVFAVAPIPIPSSFFPDKEETSIFRSMVSTKIVQRYGILKSVETFDHGASVKVENLIYDSETGDVLLTKSNNNFNDDIFDVKYPAYWAYEGMGPSYTNIGYEEKADSLIIESRSDFTVSCSNSPTFHGRLYVNKSNFSPGDELLVTYVVANDTHKVKSWVLDEFSELGVCPDPPYAYSQPQTGSGQNLHRRIVLRALRDGSGNEIWPGLNEGDKTEQVIVKVIRSGRRNQLDKTIQHIRLTNNPYSGTSSSNKFFNFLDVGNGASFYGNVLSASIQEYTDHATPYGYAHGDSLAFETGYSGHDYDPDIFPVNIPGYNRKDYNRYVLGHRGNYRPVAQYSYIAPRKYTDAYIKDQGKFSMTGYGFWNSSNGDTTGHKRTILSKISGLIPPYWKKMSSVTKYDVYGNAIEEIDPTGKYISAQYGYNKSLPVAVTTNVRQSSSSYEGFEDFSMLVPEWQYDLYKGTYYFHSPFAQHYQDIEGANHINNGYGQSYYKGMKKVFNGDTITNVTSHTGKYSLRLASSRTFLIQTRDPIQEATGQGGLNNNAKNFRIDSTGQYIVSVWVKPVSGSVTNVLSGMNVSIDIQCSTSPQSSNPDSFYLQSGNVDGWYLAISKVDFRNNDPCNVELTLPANAYYDDIRFVPIGAHMRSFVYNPLNFKLTAQLDENNFATFYEYDQEGLLIRVKKETDKGIMTVSENRRSNVKNQ